MASSVLATALGLSRSGRRRLFRGRLAGRPYLLARRPSGEEDLWSIYVSLPLPGAFRVVRRGPPGKLWIGDPAFDGELRALGEAPVLRSFLDGAMRSRLRRLFAEGTECFRASRRGLVLRIRLPLLKDREARFVSDLLSLVQHLAEPTSLRDRLLGVALNDGEVRVRAAAAEVLLRECADAEDEEIARICSALAASRAIRTRLRLDAIWALTALAAEQSTEPLLRLLKAEPPEVVQVAVARLVECAPTEIISQLPELVTHRSARVAVEAVRGLGQLGGSGAESTLQSCLLDETRVEIRAAAVTALGRVGRQPRTAQLLRAMARNRRNPERRRAKLALGELQARLPPAGSLGFWDERGGGELSLSSLRAARRRPGATNRLPSSFK